MEDRSSVERTDVSEFPETYLPTISRSRPAKSNISEPQITDRTTELTPVSDPFGTPHPTVKEPSTADLSNTG